MYSIVNILFSEWLYQQIDKRGWSQSELARRAKVSRTAISNVLNNNRQPGTDLCLAIADAFKMPPEHVFRAAGLLPPNPDNDPLLDRANHLLAQLPPEKQQEALAFLDFLVERSQSSEPDTRPRPAEGPA